MRVCLDTGVDGEIPSTGDDADPVTLGPCGDD
jgi:hypothetical protein